MSNITAEDIIASPALRARFFDASQRQQAGREFAARNAAPRSAVEQDLTSFDFLWN